MKIAFISFEYPPDTAFGGIATYVGQAARALHGAGHCVEVFAASPERSGTAEEGGILVHRVKTSDHRDFARLGGELFAQRHASTSFDVLEGPDYGADAREAVRLVPDMPLVVKLHTPMFLSLRLAASALSPMAKAWTYIGALRRGEKPFWHYNREADAERIHALEADEIASPSHSLADILKAEWGLDPAKISHVPYPYVPSPELLKIPAESQTSTVTFLGRLELRKGVLDLADAIPLVLKKHPEVRFRFVGRSSAQSPRRRVGMQEYLQGRLKSWRDSVEFTGGVPLEQIPDIMRGTDICVFPSLWESVGFVCLEAMAAGRGVVASSKGGMAEMLNGDTAGLTVPPFKPGKISDAVCTFLDNPQLRISMGKIARERVLSEYNSGRIVGLQEASYARAIERRRLAGPRCVG